MTFFNYFFPYFFIGFGILISSISMASELKSDSNCASVLEQLDLKQTSIEGSISPNNAKVLRFCPNSLSCCSDEVFDQLSNLTKQKYEDDVQQLSISMRSNFNRKQEKFNEFFEQLITNSAKTSDVMFSDTYGDLYTVNSDIFTRLFHDLRAYYRGTVLDVGEIFDSFFTEVMLRVFEILHPGYSITEEFKQCIADNMDTIKPFANRPNALTLEFSRSFVWARTFVRGLRDGTHFVKSVAKFDASSSCADELASMSHCAACQDGRLMKPCTPLCIAVLRGCLVEHMDMGDVWRSYIGGLRQLLGRLGGPYNIEAVLEPFEVKLSEAVMMLQDNKPQIEAAVLRECGIPAIKSNFTGTLGTFGGSPDLSPSFIQPHFDMPSRERRSIRSEKAKSSRGRRRRGRKSRRRDRTLDAAITGAGRIQEPKVEETRYRYNEKDETERGKHAVTALGTNLATLVTEMKRTLDTYEHHWRELPGKVCEDVAESSDTCWNGKTVSTSNDEMIEESFEISIFTDSHFHSHMNKLRNELSRVVSQLKQGYKGIDPHIPTDEEASYSGEEGSGKNLDESLFPVESTTVQLQAKAIENSKECVGCGGGAIFFPNILLICSSVLLLLVT